MIGCYHTSFEWTRAARHIYGIIRHMQGLYTEYSLINFTGKGKISTNISIQSLSHVNILLNCEEQK